jgi:hypothetical protein
VTPDNNRKQQTNNFFSPSLKKPQGLAQRKIAAGAGVDFTPPGGAFGTPAVRITGPALVSPKKFPKERGLTSLCWLTAAGRVYMYIYIYDN